MTQIDLLIHPQWIVPIEPHGTVLTEHSIAIQNGKIFALLPTIEAKKLYSETAKEEIHLPQHVVMPGLINTHSHAAMTLFRGYADDLPLMSWLHDHLWPAEQKWVSANFVADGTRLAIAEMLRGGTTCYNDMYFFPDVIGKVTQEAGMRGSVGLVLFDFPTAWGKNPDEYFKKGIEVIEQFKNNPLITCTWAPHAPYSVSDAPLVRTMELANEYNIQIEMHIHEDRAEVDNAVKKEGIRPLKRLQKLGLLNKRLQAVHMTQLIEDDFECLDNTGVHIIHNPESNLKLGQSEICPVQLCLDSGLNVALGTDGAASNNDLDMFSEMRTAALLGKTAAFNPAAVPAATALRIATLNGAKAMAIDHITGSLEPGKAADMIAIDFSGIESQPLYDVISQLVYATSRYQVQHVWVAGKQLVNNRQLLTIDEKQLLSDIKSWQHKIRP
jgi:5-methylthioadenosine/S-adenosylhomocysteine deaminase